MTEQLSVNLPSVRGVYKFAEPMAKHTWLGVGGPAQIWYEPADVDDLQFFMQHKPIDLPFFVIGAGSNLLVRDGGVKGVVIKLQNVGFAKWKIEDNKLICGAGLLNYKLKNILPQQKAGGLEFLCSIPGTIGGAFRSNAGCFGSDLSAVLDYAKVMNNQGQIFNMSVDEFHFSYRHSNFPADLIILEACFNITDKSETEINDIIVKNDQYRRTHQPQGIRTAGSTFKNPPDNAAWKLIKAAGVDTLVVGKAKMSPQHCNFLQNDGLATASDIETLGESIRKAVKKNSGVELEWEVKRLGEFKADD